MKILFTVNILDAIVAQEDRNMDSNLSDVGSERAVLAGLFAYGLESYVEISDFLTHNSFSHRNNQVIYKCVEKILQSEAHIDLPAILSASEQLNLSEVVQTSQELEYIRDLMEYPVKQENVPHFAAQVKKFELARKAKRIANKISKDIGDINGDETIDEIVSLIESPITEFLRDDELGQKPEKLGDDIDEYLEFLIENKCDQIGLSSGFPRFDAVVGGGLRRKCVDLVSARPGVGKSVFGDNVALYNARKGIPVLMLDTEMSKEDHLNRIISNISGVPITEVATGKFAEDDEKVIRVQQAVDEIREIPYTYVSVAGAPFEAIMNTIKRWIIQDVGQDENNNTNDCLVVYDYLKLMSSSSINNNLQEYQALGFQITNLHNLAVKLDFPCLSFVQLNRDGITKESTDAVSGSDRLIWLCTSFSIFKLKSAEELAEDGPNSGNRKLVTLKARHGAGLLDGNYINMNMVGSHAQLGELRTRDEIRSSPEDGIIEGAQLPFEVSENE
jgi:replicative DNA helicase